MSPPRRWTDDDLRHVAEVFRRAEQTPARAVAQEFNIPIRATDYPIREARHRGFLAPAVYTPRVVDSSGNIKCKVCAKFKPPAEMAAGGSGRSPMSICRRCKNRQKTLKERASGIRRRGDREAQQCRAWARWRAFQDLSELFPAEFDVLYQKYLARSSDVEFLGVQDVRAHQRAVYGRPAPPLPDLKQVAK